MMRLLLLSLLVSFTAAAPRSKGQQLHNTLQAQSGGGFQYNSPYPNTPNRPALPRSDGATFQVNPITLKATQVVPQSVPQQAAPLQQPNYQYSAQPQPQNFQPQHQPQTIEVSNQAFPQAQSIPQLRPQPFPQAQPQLIAQPLSQTFSQALPQSIAQPLAQTFQQPSAASVRQDLAQRFKITPPGGALLIGSNPPIHPLNQRLISNYTKLRPIVTDTFRCGATPETTGYGYYADVDNDCQIFHICLPWHLLYPTEFKNPLTFQYSFICPNLTVFSQDSLTCTWKSEAVKCAESPQLYFLNKNFFRITNPSAAPSDFEYVKLNDIPTSPLHYDYQIINKPKTP